MSDIEVTIRLPEALVNVAREFDLLTSEQISKLLQAKIRAQRTALAIEQEIREMGDGPKTNYDRIRIAAAELSETEKLIALRSETRSPLSILEDVGHLVGESVEDLDLPQTKDDLLQFGKMIIETAAKLRDLIDGVADQEHRSIHEAKIARQDRELGEALWKDAQTDLPELQPYHSLKDAIEQVVGQQGMSFTYERLKADDSFLFPGGHIHYRSSKRGARVGSLRKINGWAQSGYSVVINWESDPRNRTRSEQEGFTPSLEETALALYRWLLEEWELPKLLEQHSWLLSPATRQSDHMSIGKLRTRATHDLYPHENS